MGRRMDRRKNGKWMNVWMDGRMDEGMMDERTDG
jgi:hypothetical protein